MANLGAPLSVFEWLRIDVDLSQFGQKTAEKSESCDGIVEYHEFV